MSCTFDGFMVAMQSVMNCGTQHFRSATVKHILLFALHAHIQDTSVHGTCIFLLPGGSQECRPWYTRLDCRGYERLSQPIGSVCLL